MRLTIQATFRLVGFWLLLLELSLTSAHGKIHPEDVTEEENQIKNKKKDVVKDIRLQCNSDNITVSILTMVDSFNGMIYPKGLSKNSTCMTEYIQTEGKIQYILPLRSCNTMSTDVIDGTEYFNTIVVQPHRKLVTNQGKGYHIRCKYRTEEKDFDVKFDGAFRTGDQPLAIREKLNPGLTASMPGSTMRIYKGEPEKAKVAEEVRIGDQLTLVVSIDDQNIYGMHITSCTVRDGLGWSEQMLINEDGCPVDRDILSSFTYSSSQTTALVRFKAHRFPYTASVYYQCQVKLCIKHAHGCDQSPPMCDSNGVNTANRRRKRQTIEVDETSGLLYDADRDDLKVKVYSGLYVNEASDFDDDFIENDVADQISSRAYDPSIICFPQRDFAIGIAIAGLILILIVIGAILCLLSKRKRRKDLSTTGSSIYSGPYSNTAYSHSS